MALIKQNTIAVFRVMVWNTTDCVSATEMIWAVIGEQVGFIIFVE